MDKDLCQADPKSFTAQWTMLLPTNDVLQQRSSFFLFSQQICVVAVLFIFCFFFEVFCLITSCDFFICRKFEATLMTCLLFDPYLKVLFNVNF